VAKQVGWHNHGEDSWKPLPWASPMLMNIKVIWE